MNSLHLNKLNRAVLLCSKLERTSVFCSKALCTTFLISKPLLKAATSTATFSRNFWESFPTAHNVYLKDGLNSKTHTLIYKGVLFNYAFYGQFVSINLVFMQLYLLAKHFYKYFTTGDFLGALQQFGPYVLYQDWTLVVMVLLFNLQNTVLYVLAQRALLRVYHKKDKDEYIFVTLDKNPFKSRLMYCKSGEMKDLHIVNLMAFFGNYEVKGRKFFIRPDLFKTALHYNQLLYGKAEE